VIYRKRSEKPSGVAGYDEFQAQETGVYVEEGHKLMERFLQL
jgi:hypothetical protein